MKFFTQPISTLELTTCHRSFIRARVTWKTEITEWTRNINEGTTLLINLLDGSGEITVALFDSQCDTFFPKIEEGSVYNFFNFEVKEADTDIKILPNPLQIFFIDETVVQQSIENIQIPIIRNTFLPLSKVSEIPEREPVDVVGICTEVRDVDERGGHLIREILLVDAELQPVMLNLWEKAARDFQGQVDDVLVVKGARAQFHNNEIKLNASWYTNVQINPDIPEAISLRDWYENQ